MSTEQSEILPQAPLAKCLKIPFSAWKDDSKRLNPRHSAGSVNSSLSLCWAKTETCSAWSPCDSRLLPGLGCWTGAFPTHPKPPFMLSLIPFLLKLKGNTSPEQLNCLFCYSKLCSSLHRKPKLGPAWNSQWIACKYSLPGKINFLLCTQSPSKHIQAPCS